MFRLTRFMRRLMQPGTTDRPGRPSAPKRPAGPVVVWNLLRRCNLSCAHCYAASANKTFHGELSLREMFQVLDDLKVCNVPALILSGGEPLLHPDLFTIAERARALGFYVGLSSNGTLMDTEKARRIAEAGFHYVGVSLDGLRTNHDRMRGVDGAFDQSLEGIRNCRDQGVKVGLRFTPTRENAADLPGLFQLMTEEKLDRFYLSHWNYAGRGWANRDTDADHQAIRQTMDWLFSLSHDDLQSGTAREIVTGNNDADGVYFLFWVRNHWPHLVHRAEKMLRQWGGNASGVGIANIDERGEVHPDIFWRHHSLGNVRNRPFSAIWQDNDDPILAQLRQKPRPVKGRCHGCHYLSICGGNTRVRACQSTGDPWNEDPGCYLTDGEIVGDLRI
ncbi:MAG: heme d1 biosynthesis radical SAM protein NirJ [Magnetococcales bacterium]|nr:heme d1 biosynthesis radical SAM protein NirJ [Magnetococcales bacterium]